MPRPRDRLPNHLTTLALLHRNPLELLTVAHLSRPWVRSRMFGLSAVFLNDPQMVRHVFSTNRDNYRLDPVRRLLLRRNFGGGIATVDGESWQRARTTSQPYFRASMLEDYARTFLAVARRCLDGIRPDEPVQPMNIVAELSLECAMRTLFSVPGPSEPAELIETARICMRDGMSLDVMDLWRVPAPVPRLLKRSVRPYERRYRDHVTALYDRQVDAMRAGSGGAGNLLGAYHNDYCTGARPRAERRLAIDNVATMLGAAFETTTLAIGWTLYFLSRAEHDQRWLHEELDAGAHLDAPPHAWPALLPRTLAAIRETLRIYAPLPGITRYAIGPDRTGDLKIRKGEYVVANIWAMHRDPEHWPHPDEYRPERFLPGRQAERCATRYMPFGIGPRTCIGRHFAELEAVVVLATLLGSFGLRPAPGPAPTPVWRGTLRPDGPVTVKFTRREPGRG